MWISIEVVPSSENLIYLPERMINRFDEEIIISFGKRRVEATVLLARGLNISGENSFENPLKIKLSSNLISALNLPDTVTYQMKYNYSSIIIGPTIGFLLGGRNYLYSPDHMEKYSDRFGVYNQIGGLIYAFSYKSIDWNNKVVYGLYYDNKETKWKYGKFPLPTVIYRRDFHTDSKTEKKLANASDGKMFNSWRFTKFYLHKHLERDERLASHLPPTELTHSYEQIKIFIDNYTNVILKPTDLSRGRGICIINKEDNYYKVFDYRSKKIIEMKLDDENALKSFFESNQEFFNKYLIQKQLSLAKVNGAPFDIRVVMQKEKPIEWKCSGIECRVAAKQTLVTNISRGGYALTLDDALQKAFPECAEEQERIKQKLYSLCQKLCKSLEETGHHFAELGMDIAIDDEGNLWIIEVNVFPSFKGFKVMNYNTYLEIRHTPILYAAHLAGF